MSDPVRSAHRFERNPPRRALVLAGGGLKGGFQAGAISEIEEPFDFIVGTSIGAYHACYLSQWRKEGWSEARQRLPDLWTQHLRSSKDVYKWYKPKVVSGAVKQSFAHVRPLEKLMDKLIAWDDVRRSNVPVYLPAVDLNTGETIVFDRSAGSIKQAAHASAAYPAVFPWRHIDGHYLTDGGVRVTAGVEVALEHGATEIVVVHHARPFFQPAKLKNAFGYAMRCIDIMADEVVRNDLAACDAHNRIADLEAAIDALPETARLAARRRVGPRWESKRVDISVIGPTVDIGEGLEGDEKLTKHRIAHGRAMGRLYQEAKS
jgi:NTE family protein